MNISENIARIKQGKESIITALQNKGSDISNNTLINEISTYVDKLEIGGGGDTPSQPEIPELVQKYEGATVFRINVPTDNYEFAINLCNDATKATYDVDWGDGVLESGLTTDEQHHIYSKAGTYDVNIYNISKDITIVAGSSNKGVQTKYISNVFNNTNNDTYIPFLGIETHNIYICTDILFGDKITSIGNNAFYNYKSLKSVTISENVTSIGSGAFIGSGLKYLNFNAINCNDFSNNSYFGTNLVFVKIGNKVQKIPNYFLYNNNFLTSITISNSVTSIGSSAFNNCSKLTSITIPDSVTSIGSTAFRDCTSLQNIVIPEGVTSIGSDYAYTFAGCSSLTSITIPDSVTTLGYYIFDSCKKLKNVILPKSIKQIPQNGFSGCSSLTSINIPEGVTSIGSNAFYNCSSLTSVTIPNSVTSIGTYAFNNCSSLTSINIPEGVTSIGSSAFKSCSNLTSITIPDSVTSIGSTAFESCYSLYDINLGNVKTISNNSFYGSYLYTKLTIPSSVTSIGNNAFYLVMQNLYLNTLICEPLTAPTIQTNSFGASYDSAKLYMYIHKNADIESYTSGNWKTYMLDKGWELRYIEDYEKEPTTLKIKTTNNFFNDLSNIEQANLINYELINDEYVYHFDDKINLLHQYLFEKNTLENIEIPSTVTTIGSSAFLGCSSLTSITIPNSVTSIGSNAFYDCSSLTSVTIPNSVTSIGTYAFNNCSSLQSITIPDSVTSIANSTFYDCSSLTSVTIPNSVTSIGTYAFNNCSKLSTITCKAMTAPTIQRNTFNSVGSNVPSGTPKVLRVPEGSSGYEETTSEWYKQLISIGYKVEYITQPNNEIWYTSTDGNIVEPQNLPTDNTLLSNTYENGKGVIVFENDLTELRPATFRSSNIETVTLPNSISKISNYVFVYSSLKEIVLPNNLTELGTSTFQSCTRLDTITLPSTLKKIDNYCFQDCTALTSINIPNNMEYIGTEAFINCTNMNTIICDGSKPDRTGDNLFTNVGVDVSSDTPKILYVHVWAGEDWNDWLELLGEGWTIEYIN